MSRIGKQPIGIPGGVTVKYADGEIEVKGPKGLLTQRLPSEIGVEIDAAEVRLVRPDDEQKSRALHGLARALTANMVHGVTEGFVKDLEILGVGYRAEASGNKLNMTLGFSHPVSMEIPKGLSVSVEATTKIKIAGIDKELVGQFAADIRKLRPPEPYKGKGIRYANEQIRRKVGKTGAA